MHKTLSMTCILIVCTAISLKAQTTYPVSWTELVNVVVNPDNSLTKTSSSGWNAAAASLNMLRSGEDGYVQWTWPSTGTQYMVSLSGINSDVGYSNNMYTMELTQTGVIRLRHGSNNLGIFGTAAPGDVLKIAREGAAVNFYQNNTVLHTIAAAGSGPNLRVDVTMNTFNGTLPPLYTSFDKTLMVRPQFQFPGLSNDDGAISVQVDGAYEPVTYQWSSGEQTASISNKPRGSYTLTVSDAQGRTVVKTYNLQYPVAWTNIGNVVVNPDNTIKKTISTAGYDAGASSLNILPPQTDGWLEFIIVNPSPAYKVGFARVDSDFTQASINYGFEIARGGGIRIQEGNSNKGNFSTIVYGDILRIAREGSQIKYYVNGSLKWTTNANAAHTYIVDVTVHTNAQGPVPVVVTSFDKEIRLNASVMPPDNGSANGSIGLSISGAYEPFTVQWSSGEQTSSISDKQAGTYTVSVSDAAGRTLTRTYEIGHKVFWSDLRNISVDVNSLSKVNNTEGWNASAISANYLPPSEDGWVEFIVGKAGQRFCMGLARVNSELGFGAIDYGFFFQGTGDVSVYEKGVNRGLVGNHLENAVYKVARENGFIRYYINGSLVRSVATNYSHPLMADVSLYHTWAPPATVSFQETPEVYYAIAEGNWANPETWSLSTAGSPGISFPGPDDIVHVNGFKVNVTSGVTCAELRLSGDDSKTCIEMSGGNSELRTGVVRISGDGSAEAARVLIVQNGGKIEVMQ